MKRMFLLMLAVGALAVAGTAKAAVYYVDTTGVESDSLIATVAQAKANPQIDTIYVAIGLYKMDKELIVEDVIIGGCTFGSNNSVTRQYPGAVGNNRNRMTVLDGNSLVLSLSSQKHRVATINKGGVIDGCLIRNGHARGTTNNPNDTKGFGGGVLINTGGKLHNSIVCGNVAMNLQFSKTNPSYGGGVYVNGGDVANSIIAFNLDDMGLGIGGSSGTILNNTIARNANAPRYVLISGTNGTPYRHYQYTSSTSPTANLVLPYIELDSFYIATTETTIGQYACFLAAIDLQAGRGTLDWAKVCDAATPMYGYTGISILKYCGVPTHQILAFMENVYSTESVGISGTAGSGSEVYYPLKMVSEKYFAGTSGDVSYPQDPLIRENFPMGCVTWIGGIAFSVWIGGMLPTEAQWEYAARKRADGSIYSDGSYAGGYTDVNKVGWHNTNSTSSVSNRCVHEVALLLPTELGLYDMNGNLDELCVDTDNGSYHYPNGASIGTDHETGRLMHSYLSTVSGVTGSTPATAVHNPVYTFSHSASAPVTRGGRFRDASYRFQLGYRNKGYFYNASNEVYGFRTVACVGL